MWRWDQQEPFGSNPADDNPSGLGVFDLPLRLPGQYLDKETNLHYNAARNYDASIGRYEESDLIGLILKWTWIAELVGVTVNIERTGSMITIEYVWGMLAVALLGYFFYKFPIWCAAWFMLGPTIVTHGVHLVRFGIPQQWLLEVFVLGILTIPYVGIAYAAAYVHRRSVKRTT